MDQPQQPPQQQHAPPYLPPPKGAAPSWTMWLTKNWRWVSLLLFIAFIWFASKGNSTAQARIKAGAEQASKTLTGPRLAEHPTLDYSDSLVKQVTALQERNAVLMKKMNEIQNGGAATSATSSSAAAYGNGYAQPPTTPQLSAREQMAQQIEADQLKQEYTSLWSSPIAAVREKPAESAFTQKQADESTPSTKDSATSPAKAEPNADPNIAAFAYDKADGPFHVVPRYTMIGGTLMNAISSSTGGAMIIQVGPTDKVYLGGTKIVLIPEGTILMGRASTITATGQNLMAATVDEIQMPDKYGINIPAMDMMSQDGETGVTGHVDHHAFSKFGWTILMAGFAGVSEIGNSTSALTYSPSATFRQQFGDNLGQQAEMQLSQQVMNRPNTVTIPAGTRVKMVLAKDLTGVPEWGNHHMPAGSL